MIWYKLCVYFLLPALWELFKQLFWAHEVPILKHVCALGNKGLPIDPERIRVIRIYLELYMVPFLVHWCSNDFSPF